jgi:hypothetical protein
MTESEGRFTREGSGLDHWLWELVCDEMDRRDHAAQIVSSMHMEIPGDTNVTAETIRSHFEAFNTAVRDTLDRPDFDTRAFLEALIVFMDAAQAHRMGLWKKEQARVDRVADKLVARLGRNPTPEELATFIVRMARVICTRCDEKNVSARTQERLLSQQVTALTVFGALGEQLLLLPHRLRAMLRDPHDQHRAAEALKRIGPPAIGFAEQLLAELDAGDGGRSFRFPDTLASVIRDDTDRVRQVVDRLDSITSHVAEGAAYTLFHLGPRAAELNPQCVEELLKMSEQEDVAQRGAATAALGRVTRGTDAALDRLLELSRDDDMWVRGPAITALGDVAQQPERVVPRLIEAFDDYDEPDPDWSYRSDHERVTEALQEFGHAAAPAVSALAARIRNAEGEADQGVIETLGKLGPIAREALPGLEELARESEYDEDDLADDTDYLAVAPTSIRGEPTG